MTDFGPPVYIPPSPLPAPAWLSSQGTATLRPGWSRPIHLESLPGQAPGSLPTPQRESRAARHALRQLLLLGQRVHGTQKQWLPPLELQSYSFKTVRAPLQSLSLAFQWFFRGKGHPRFKARGRDQPRFTGLGRDRTDARLQNPGFVRQPCLHLPEVLPLWTGGQGFKTESVHLPLHKLRLPGQCRSERSAKHLGLRGWGCCTGRGVLARDLYDP